MVGFLIALEDHTGEAATANAFICIKTASPIAQNSVFDLKYMYMDR